MMIYDVLGIIASVDLLALSTIHGRVACLFSLHHMAKVQLEEAIFWGHLVPLLTSASSAGLCYPEYLSTVPS